MFPRSPTELFLWSSAGSASCQSGGKLARPVSSESRKSGSHLSVDTDVPQTLLAGVESTVKAVYAFAAGSALYVGFCSVFELTRKPVREFGVRTTSGRGNILPSSSIN